MNRFFVTALVCAITICAAGCVVVFRGVQVQQINPGNATTVASAVKAHLKDGSTVVYDHGVVVSGGTLLGAGIRYDLALKESGRINSLPLDSVIGMESFRTRVNVAESAVVSTLATAGIIAGSAVLAVAIFGSCPTVYSDNGKVEEAELFSNSIAPLFEARDVDRLRAQPDTEGTLRLELRNEAMETHYINHLQLFEVAHAENEFVLPDPQGHPLIVSGVRTPDDITDRSGHNQRATLGAVDEAFYKTDPKAIDKATADDLNDWIDLTAPVPDGADSTTLVFRLRNSLLSTTLLYDVMLGPAGARAIDWLGSGLSRISTAVELGRWHERRAGLHIMVWRDNAWQEVSRVPDSGPIAWHDVAAVIPAQKGEKSLRIRLSFLADHWRIDHVGVASAERQPTPRVIPLSRVTGSDGRAETAALENMTASDDRYLQTNPGQRFFADFNVGPAAAGQSRTFLLSSQGYYTEWIRGSWIKNASAKEPFTPTDQSILTALQKWSVARDSFEARFVKERVPVN